MRKLNQPELRGSGRSRALAFAGIAALVLYLLYLFGITRMGLIGPDEPRYAAIGREMARSGDWITPRLWGDVWFEKPPLLYWMTGAAFRLGLSEDLAPRLPVVLSSIAFLVFFHWIARRQFGPAPALFATVILATSAGWLSYSGIGVTDLPMSALFSAAMLLSLDWIQRGERRFLPAAAVFLGLAVLAKGLAPLVLALPLVWAARGRLGGIVRPPVIGAFLIVALPWYLLCFVKNGGQFLQTFFWQHHVERFTSGALQHSQPLWFFAPVLLLFLFPWTPALFLLFNRKRYSDPRRVFLLLWIAFGFAFFSISANKLPGYILPLLPPIVILIGTCMAESGSGKLTWALTLCGVPLGAIPLCAQILPQALAGGLSRGSPPQIGWLCLLFAMAGPVAGYLEYSRRRMVAIAVLCFGAVAGVVFLKVAVYPNIDRAASARPLWRRIAQERERVCVDHIARNWRYGLNYYAVEPLPDCENAPRAIQLFETPGQPPSLRHR